MHRKVRIPFLSCLPCSKYLRVSAPLRFCFWGNFLGNLLRFLFQAHKHRKVRLSVLPFALSSQNLLNSLQNYLASPIPEMGFGTDLQRS